jgi:hypothetical protein
VPIGEPLPERAFASTFRAQQVQHVIEEIKAPTSSAEKIDAHFQEGKFARLWVAAYT